MYRLSSSGSQNSSKSASLALFQLPEHHVNCPCCGEQVCLPALNRGEEASCPRCHYPLVRIENNPIKLPLILVITALLVIILVYSQLYILVEMPAVYSYLTLPEMMATLISLDFGLLAEVMFIFTFATPVIFCLLVLYIFTALTYWVKLPFLLQASRLLSIVQNWMMIDVFFISTLVAYIKVSTVAKITFGAAFGLMFILSLLLIRASQSIQMHWIYYQIQQLYSKRDPTNMVRTAHTINCSNCLYHQPTNKRKCSFCGTPLFHRYPNSLQLSFAFLLAAIILYFPANLMPVMISSDLTTIEINTILDGIFFMWRNNDKLIAVIIFSASVGIPIIKIIALLILLYSARFHPLFSAHRLEKLYRFTEMVGRWSMVDIFVIILLMSAFHTPVANVTPGPAAIYFCLVVILTMLSAHYFDPRLIWDKIKLEHQSN